MLKILEFAEISEVRPEIFEIPEIRFQIPGILKSGVQALKGWLAPLLNKPVKIWTHRKVVPSFTNVSGLRSRNTGQSKFIVTL